MKKTYNPKKKDNSEYEKAKKIVKDSWDKSQAAKKAAKKFAKN